MATITVNTEAFRVRGFRYLWLKTVIGFDPTKHCARCLLGNYVEEVSPAMPANQPVELDLAPGTIAYLCGVSTPYRWASNLHVAFEVQADHDLAVKTYMGDTVTIDGARRILFTPDAAKRRFPDKGHAFLSCRNFQFGASHFRD